MYDVLIPLQNALGTSQWHVPPNTIQSHLQCQMTMESTLIQLCTAINVDTDIHLKQLLLAQWENKFPLSAKFPSSKLHWAKVHSV